MSIYSEKESREIANAYFKALVDVGNAILEVINNWYEENAQLNNAKDESRKKDDESMSLGLACLLFWFFS